MRDNTVSLCLSNSPSTNTANRSPAAPQLLLSLSQWGGDQTSVDSGVAPLSLMIHTMFCQSAGLNTHWCTRLVSQPASRWRIVQLQHRNNFSCADSQEQNGLCWTHIVQ